jgi:hypothetical protein
MGDRVGFSRGTGTHCDLLLFGICVPHLQRGWRSMGKMEGDEPTWIVPAMSKPCRS